MNFKNWLITEEIWQNGTATVYHRTKKENIQSILSNNWQIGGGQLYGAGLYTTFALKSQFTSYMRQYGDTLLKFKVKDLNKYVICSTSVATQILGKQFKISDQLKNLNLSDLYTEEQIKNFDEMMSKEVYSSETARKMFETNRNLQNRAKGIIYYGQNDGYCLVKYEPVEDGTITLLGYAKIGTNETEKMDALLSNCEKDQEGKCKNPWTTSTELLKIKTLYGLPAEKKQNYATIKRQYNDLKKIISEPNVNFKKVKFYFARNKELINDLSDVDVYKLLDNTADKDKMAKFIIQNKKDLTDNNVYNLLHNATSKDEIGDLIIQKKKDLTSKDIYTLLVYATNPYEMSKLFDSENINELISSSFDGLLAYATNKDEIAKLIIKNKKDLTSENVFNLLYYAKNKDEIAKLLGYENINKLYNVSVRDWLRSATDPDEAAKVVIQYIKDLTENDVYDLLDFTEGKDEIARLIIQYIKDLTDDNVYQLLKHTTNKDEIANLIIQNKKYLTSSNMALLRHYATNKD
jgi:hypothetical protein